MSEAQLRFEISEYKSRLDKARNAMEKVGLDLLVVTDPANMGWLTGYDGCSYYVPQCVVVSKDQDPLWFGRRMDANGCRRTAYISEDRIKWYGDEYVQSDTLHAMSVLGQIVADEGHGSAIIGVEKDSSCLSAASFEALYASLPNAKFKNADRLINWQRLVKSPREIEYMRGAGKIVEAMYERVTDVLRPGVKQSDVIAELSYVGTRGVDGYWGDYPACVPNLGAGADASAPHLTWTDRPIRANESIFFELAGVHKRYHCPLSRTYYLGQPTSQILDAEKAVLEGMEAGLEKALAGNCCEDISKAYTAALARGGFEKTSRSGYPIGMGYPPAWGENSASFRSGDKTELRPGMTFHFMSGLWYGDWGIEITESILITEGKVEFLSKVPRKLFVIE
ncbi:M24 family metallopeptidase [Sinorhizobium saheli]|uniref:Ectoine hydrolase DoeA n=1 Tax=Sinorhizobium saheli TaxID=36856 RepID=A0A178YSI2_SINSA|nr:Xaa-Pro peptidase family protein [Sinorhizobium saheli]MQW90029.1 M24 family metallopeptidase [Sinorhizobium saheli]OAP50414.1 ectoine hydrolase DoeA [Sinorhizobium saheli]